MKINKESNQVIIRPKGEINSNNAVEFKQKLLEFYDSGYDKIVIDFAQLEAIQSSGIGVILLIHDKLVERGGELEIVNVESEYVKKVFKMTKLDKIINIK